MPFYNYTTEDGVTIQRLCRMDESSVRGVTVQAGDTVLGPTPIGKLVGKMAWRDVPSEHKTGGVCNKRLWPKRSEGLSVNPSQAGELREHLAEHNVSCDVRDNGDAYVGSVKNFRDHQRLRGFVDKGSYQ